MMRNAKVDINQSDIVAALRKEGFSVTLLHTVGKGIPDLLIGYKRINLLLEVKYLKGGLTKDQTVWHREWQGQVDVVRTPEDAVELVYKLTNTEI